jgi:aspartate racemase
MSINREIQRKKIGIITGSGPEAGVDMWEKLLQANKLRFGKGYRGDLDAPNVTIISEPNLGLSMEMERNEKIVWHYLKKAASALSPMVNHYAIACNTLNCYQDKLSELKLSASLISFSGVVIDYIRQNGLKEVCLLGARPVMSLGKWSAYRQLPKIVDIEVLKDAIALHQLIYDIKTYGPSHKDITPRFERILEDIRFDTVLLACTELPLIKNVATDKILLDVTYLVAEKLVEISFAE